METRRRALAATLLSVAVLLLASPYAAQMVAQTIRPPAGGGTAGLTCTVTTCTFTSAVSGTSAFFTGPVSIGNTSAAPYANLYGSAANTLAIHNGGTAGATQPQIVDIYNFCDGANCATGYSKMQLYSDGAYFYIKPIGAGTGSTKILQIVATTAHTGNFFPGASDTYELGTSSAGGINWRYSRVSRSLIGSKSTALADNTKKAFATLTVAAGAYGGGDIIYTLYCADASDRVTQSGRLPISVQNTGGTETCAVGTPITSGDSTNNAKAFSTVTFTCADGGTNMVQYEVQADCSIVTPTTLTIEHRFDMPKDSPVTPAT